MKIAKKHDPPDNPVLVRPVNALFKARIPVILEQISDSLIVIEPAVQDMTVPLREFLDYLEFEIAKVSLQIEKDAWKSVISLDKADADDAWLEHLQQLRKDFDVEKMTASTNFIRDMMKRVRSTFDMRTPY